MPKGRLGPLFWTSEDGLKPIVAGSEHYHWKGPTNEETGTIYFLRNELTYGDGNHFVAAV